MVHKTWKQADEKKLVEEFKRLGCTQSAIPQLAKRFDRSPEAIAQKLRRLGVYGLNVVGGKIQVTTTFEKVKDLPSLEEVLKILAAALHKATEPGLGKTELQRLDTIATLFSKYVDGLERFVQYRKIEERLLELEKKYGDLAKEKSKDHASKRDPAHVVQATAK